MNGVWLELLALLVLLVINGVFAMTEIAIISSRKGLLQHLAEQGHHGAKRAIKLAAEPDRFLSTVQIGITLVGPIAGILGGGTAASILAEWIARVPGLELHSKWLALIVVVGMITYLSLVIGELVPKRLAMKYPERIACVMAGPMAGLAWVATPLVNLLARSTHRMLCLFGVRDSKETGISREELHGLLRQGMTAGTINEVESQMMQRVIEFEKLDVYDIMIPRPKMIWIEQDSAHDEVWPTLVSSAQNVFPVYRGRRENLVGAVTVKEIYGRLAKQEPVVFKELMQEPLWVPETQKASDLLEKFRQTGQRAAFVINEFGSVMGMVTLMDLMESIVGEVPSREEQQAMPIQQREDGSWLIDGLFEIEKLSERLEGFDLPEGGGKEFQTVSGWFIRELGRLPVETDRISTPQWVFEVVDIDGVRVDKIIATRRAPEDVNRRVYTDAMGSI